jgi:hypothetical protein
MPTTKISRQYLEDLVAERNELRDQLNETRYVLKTLMNTSLQALLELGTLLPPETQNEMSDQSNGVRAQSSLDSAKELSTELAFMIYRVHKHVDTLTLDKKEAQESDAMAMSVVDEIFAAVTRVQPNANRIEITNPQFTKEQLDWIWACIIDPAQGVDERHGEEWFKTVSKFFG